jgi:hypothetical protein
MLVAQTINQASCWTPSAEHALPHRLTCAAERMVLRFSSEAVHDAYAALPEVAVLNCRKPTSFLRSHGIAARTHQHSMAGAGLCALSTTKMLLVALRQ